ncbi:hypothetical protein D4Q76_00585 [archaeon]|nr:MAG: hypothetical protein D4Q76_00585 [archaeon]
MSCVYGNAADGFFKKVSVYSVENPSNIERKISDFAGNISDRFRHGDSVENHLAAYLVLSAAAAAAHGAGVPTNQAMAFYAPAVVDVFVHANDFAVPRIKTAIKNILTENPYAGNGMRPDNP